MSAVSFPVLAQISMEHLLNGLAEGLLIAVFAWVLLRVVGRKNSGTRFVVWFSALVAIAVSPFVSFGSAGGIARNAAAAVTIPDWWSAYLFAAWAAVAAVGLARVVIGLWHLHGLRRNCAAVDASALDSTVAATLEEFRAGRGVQLLSSEDLRVPTAIGFFRPAVIVPAWALRELSATELNAVVLHELAHLRRWDDWTNLAQKTLGAVFFFHPAVWFVENRLSLEREMACDDLVLAQTADPRGYAECLVSLGEKNLVRRGIALAQAAVGRMQQTSRRVLQILDSRRPKSVKVWQPAPLVVAGFSVVCLVSAAHAPKLVGFGGAATAAGPQIQNASFASTESVYAPPVVPAKYVAPENAGPLTKTKRDLKTSPRLLTAAHGSRVGNRKGIKTSSPSHVVPIPRPQAPAAARVVRTAFTESSPVVLLQETVYVVVQNPALGGAPLVWQFSVWQLRLSPQGPAHLAPAIPSKSI